MGHLARWGPGLAPEPPRLCDASIPHPAWAGSRGSPWGSRLFLLVLDLGFSLELMIVFRAGTSPSFSSPFLTSFSLPLYSSLSLSSPPLGSPTSPWE